MITKIIEDFLKLISDNMAETQFERDKLFVLKVIERGGAMGVRKNIVTRSTHRILPNVREMALRDLLESGEVVVKVEGKTTHYFKAPWGLNINEHQQGSVDVQIK